MRKKVLVLDTGREWGGGTNSLLELLKRIDRNKYEFTALFYKNYKAGGSSDIKTELGKVGVGFILLERQEQTLYSKALKETGRTLLSFNRGLKKKYIFKMDYSGRIVPDSKRIATIIKEKGFDLLYMNNQPSSNLEGILAAKEAGVPSIQHSRVEVRLNAVEAGAVNKCVSKVICVSRGVMDSLVESGVERERCTVVYNGIDKGFKPLRTPQDIRKEIGCKEEFLIGTVGSLIKRKRVNLLIDAMEELKGIEGLKCVIVGEGPEAERLKTEALKKGITDKIIFTGFSTDALSYINAMDVFVLPSEKEGLPRVVLEAMLMGKPVVAFDVVGTGELIVDGRTGFLLKEENGSALASAIRKLYSDKGLMKRMGEEGRIRVMDNFGIDKYVSGVGKVFKEVLN